MKSVKMNIQTYCLACCIVLAAGSAGASVVFFDNFDGQPLGNLGTSVPIGMQWYNSAGVAINVVNTYAQSGTQSLAMSRLSGGAPTLFGLSSTGTAVAGNTVKISYDQSGQGYDSLQTWINFGTGIMGGVVINGSGYYAVQNNGVNVASSLKPSALGTWDHIEMFVSLVSAGSNLGGTYEVYVTKGGSSRTRIAAAAALIPKATDTIARVEFQEGYGFENYIDNVKIETVATPVCGDTDHPHPTGDLNGDCKINFADFAVMAANWLKCATVACP